MWYDVVAADYIPKNVVSVWRLWFFSDLKEKKTLKKKGLLSPSQDPTVDLRSIQYFKNVILAQNDRKIHQINSFLLFCY